MDPTPAGRLRWFALAAILTTHCMDLLDGMMVNTAAPVIGKGLHGSSADLQWMGAGYALAFASLLITGGRLGDIAGRKRMLLTGTAGFTCASLLAGLAVNPEMIISARIVQGCCAAVMVPQGLGIMRELFPPRELPKAIGMMGPVVGIAAIVAPLLGGALTTGNLFGLGWRAVFFVNLPLGVLALFGAVRYIPGRPPAAGASLRRLDGTGTALTAGAMVLVAYPLMQGRTEGWPTWCFVSMAAALPVLVLLGVHQSRRARARRAPLIEPSLVRNGGFVAALVVGVLYYLALSGMMFALQVQLQTAHGFTALGSGLAMVPWTAGSAVGSAVTGSLLVRRFGGRRTLRCGLALLVVGAVGVIAVVSRSHAVSAWQLLVPLSLLGLGMGGVLTPYYNISLAMVTLPETGAASGLLNSVQQLGNGIGYALLGTVFFSCLTSGHRGADDALRVTFWLAAGLLAAAFLIAFWMRPPTHRAAMPDNTADRTDLVTDGQV
ncbi:MFS transporter [Streptomyces griseofuscus]|uniref:MFS transporter n=1 Tax=Streptomyces TaxID=1883 RepID=UPI00081DE99D|nr:MULTISPECIES: MFS transporter [unclassified Streptomyces]MBJ6999526.1 MFS transporter [Streptomyces sp. CRPSP2-6A1]MYQ91934.1 MFS transporter [Streptomyces sp. SID4946]SCF71006.1 drug resistance transporter, EmrB/QacA subfamily [Streptomyces sp. DconLS]SCG03156.1 drug resistance transporter, EmrB/QacA subfamily [Streptomyces sp. LamerLS-31b]